jgi:hypothetical protein
MTAISAVRRSAGPILFVLFFIAVLASGLGIGAHNANWIEKRAAGGNSPNALPKSGENPEPWLTKDAAGFFTFLLVVVGTCQLGLFIWQLWLINQSLIDAKEAAEAAKDSAEVAHRAIDATERRDRTLERAYLWPGYGLLILDKRDYSRVGIHLGIRNTGRTAGIVKTVHHALLSEEDFASGRIITYRKFDGRENAIIPDPNTEARSGVWHRLSEMPKISCGWLTYIDVFNSEQRQGWKYRADATGRTDPLPGCYTYEPWNDEYAEIPSDQEPLPPDVITEPISISRTA